MTRHPFDPSSALLALLLAAAACWLTVGAPLPQRGAGALVAAVIAAVAGVALILSALGRTSRRTEPATED